MTSQKNIPTYVSRSISPSERRIVVCSIPKSGTYLIGDLLNGLGYEDTKLHLGYPISQDYRDADKHHALSQPNAFDSKILWPRILRSIQPGQYALSHLPSDTHDDLREFNVIFLYRNLRDVLSAYARFVARTGRWGAEGHPWTKLDDGPDKLEQFIKHHSEMMLGVILPVAEWSKRGKQTPICFEALVGDLGSDLQDVQLKRLSHVTGCSLDLDAIREKVGDTLQTPTMTKSEKRTEWKSMWSPAVEDFFSLSGLKALNAELGYENNSIFDLRRAYATASLHSRQCPVCGSRDEVIVCQNDRHHLRLNTVVCRQCTLTYCNSAPPPAWIDRYYEEFENNVSLRDIGSESTSKQSSPESPPPIITDLLPEIDLNRILLVGCTSAKRIEAIAKQWPKADIYGLDIRADVVRDCRSAGFEVFQFSSTWYSNSLEADSCDLAIVSDLLEQCNEPSTLLTQIIHSLSTDGYLYIDVPNVLSNAWFGTNSFHLGRRQIFNPAAISYLVDSCHMESLEWLMNSDPSQDYVRVLARKSSSTSVSTRQSSSRIAAEICSVLNHIERQIDPPTSRNMPQRFKRWLYSHKLLGPITDRIRRRPSKSVQINPGAVL